MAHKAVRPPRPGARLVYIARMAVSSLPTDRQRGPIRRLLPLLAIGLLAAMAFVAFRKGGISFEALVANREAIGAFPSVTLAEGEYVLIARHEGKVFTREFKIESGLDRDIEIIATP